MWSDRRAEAARAQLTALATAQLDAEEVQASAMAIVRRVVPFDAACWATVDPDTLLFTGSMTVEFEPGPALEQRFIALEAAGEDPNPFRDLARGPRPVARLSDAGPAALEASSRLQEIWRPLGVRHEIRAAFTVANRCWGVGGMLRSSDSRDFSDPEVAFLAAVTPEIGAAIRGALLRRSSAGAPEGRGPAVLILGADGETLSATPAAQELLEGRWPLGTRTGRFALQSLAAAVRQGAGSARVRLHDPHHGWLVLQASRLSGRGAAPQIAITLTPAASRDLTDLLLEAHGLSVREREVTRAVLAGTSTTDMARTLCISANTVQDHLKAIFDKMGVRSRRDLTAYINGSQPRNTP